VASFATAWGWDAEAETGPEAGNLEARGNAGVTCVITGIRNKGTGLKHIFSKDNIKEVKGISPYLIEGSSLVMTQRKVTISDIPEMALGSSGIDGGHLIFDRDEKNRIESASLNAQKFIKPFLGDADIVKGGQRFCLWIDDDQVCVPLPKS